MSVKPVYRLNRPAIVDRSAVLPTVSGGEIRPVTMRVVGDETHIRAVIRNHRTRGTLVEYGIPKRLRDGRTAVDITILQANTDPGYGANRPRWTRKHTAIVAAVMAATGVAGYGLYLLVNLILSSLPVIAALLVAMVLLPAAGLAVRAGCRGMHCDGCT